MAQTIKQREYLFRARPKRTRPALAIVVLGAASLVATGLSEGTAGDARGGARAVVYGAVGGPERFVLAQDEDGTTIRFTCLPSETACVPGAPERLREVRDGDADVLTDRAGRPVLTLAVRGARLHAGSDIVPATVPAKGRAVLPTDAEA